MFHACVVSQCSVCVQVHAWSLRPADHARTHTHMRTHAPTHPPTDGQLFNKLFLWLIPRGSVQGQERVRAAERYVTHLAHSSFSGCMYPWNFTMWRELDKKLDSLISGFQTFLSLCHNRFISSSALFLQCHYLSLSLVSLLQPYSCCQDLSNDTKGWAMTHISNYRSESFWWSHALHHVPAMLCFNIQQTHPNIADNCKESLLYPH